MEGIRHAQISAGILAGGKSSRMGREKSRLRLGNREFIEIIADACRDFAELLISADAAGRFPELPYRVIPDERSGFGPVEGIYQLLRASRTQYVLVVATDMPFLTAPLLNALAQRVTGGEDCLVLRRDGRPEPLCSIYSRTAIPALQAMRAGEISKIRLLYDRVRVRYVDLESLGFSDAAVANINTAEDYRRATGEDIAPL